MTTRSAPLSLALVLVGITALAAETPIAVADDSRSQGGQWCTSDRWGQPRPIPHLRRQQQVVAEALRVSDPDFEVRKAKATHLGVIALVSGDLAKATRELGDVDHVVSWTGNYLSHYPRNMRMSVVLQQLLEPVLEDVLGRVRGVPGRGTPAYWTLGGAVVLTWKDPIPAQVRAVDGVLPSGAEVRVVPRPYSIRDFERSKDRLKAFLDARGVDWSSLGACGSEHGLELSIPGEPGDLSVTQDALDRAAGMRVLVIGGVVVVPA